MNNTFASLGAGMQGTAAAYDLAKFSQPAKVVLGDVSIEQARRSAARVNKLLGTNCCEAKQVNALDPADLHKFLSGVDVLLSCVPYWMHPSIAKQAIKSGVNMCDLGGNTDITLETLALDGAAKAAGVTLVPDCGLAPGLVNNIGCWLLENLDEPESIKLYCGVLPQHPKPPLNYKLTFNVEGLVTEYDFQAVALRNGEISMIDTLSELEDLRIEQLGQMEAFTTSGGTSTAPYTFQGRVPSYEYKTIRFPGHCERIKMFRDFGFWNPEKVEVGGVEVAPREVFYKVFGEALAKFEDLDLCVVRGVGTGQKGGEKLRLQVDIFDKQDEQTGFTSMERLTGFSMAIVATEIAEGHVAKGAVRYEVATSGKKFLDKLQERGVGISFEREKLSD